MKTSLSPYCRIALILAASACIVSVFVPIWGIYLVAPQYPEGLSMQIWASKLTGDIDIINGLNHYIGMREIHADEFTEFKILPYAFFGLAFFFILSAVLNRKKWFVFSSFLFAIIALLSAYDFWQWEYDYGHHLDPNAAIKVPGMAYQPPLLGFKQLLNFGAYSVPEIGGWLLLGVAVLLIVSLFYEYFGSKSLAVKKSTWILFLMCALFFVSCSNNQPEQLQLNTDTCYFCQMGISDANFGCELITSKGRVYKFDDLHCMFNYVDEQSALEVAHYFVNDYGKNNVLINAKNAWYVHSEKTKSPMGGNTVAFSNKQMALQKAASLQTTAINWQNLKLNHKNVHKH
jgi:copper chaperone NosL